MKKILITGMLIMLALQASAQQTGKRYDDKAAPPPTPAPPPEINRANKVEGIQMKSTSEIEAEKEAKEKGSNKNQTEVNPDRIAPIVKDTAQRTLPRRR